MSQTDTITSNLRAMRAGIDRARSTAAAVDGEAEKVAARAAAAGFSAIAGGVAQVRQAIRDVQGRLGGLGGMVDEASTSVGAVSQATSPMQVIAALTRTVERLNAVHEGITASAGRVDEIKNLITRVLQGGDPGRLLSMLDGIKQALALTAQQGAATKQSLDVAIGEARQIGASGN